MKRALWVTAGAALCASSFADFTDNFEAYTGSDVGTTLPDPPWYVPAGSNPQRVFTYTGNSLGFPALLVGGNNFAGSRMDGTAFNRGQRDTPVAGGLYTASNYFCVGWDDVTNPFSNIASFSTQPAGNQQSINLLLWLTGDGSNPDDSPFAGYIANNEVGTSTGFVVGFDLAAAFSIVPPTDARQRWFRWTGVLDYDGGNVRAMSVTDMTDGTTFWVFGPFPIVDEFGNPLSSDCFMSGGENNALGQPNPTAVRMFTGGGAGANPGNEIGYDWVGMNAGFHTIPEALSCSPGSPTGVKDERLLFEDDAQRVIAGPGIVISTALPPLVFNMEFQGFLLSPASMSLAVDGHASAPVISREIQCKRAGTTTWDTIGAVSNFPANTDAEVTATISANTSQYIDQTTGTVEWRIRCKAVGPVISYPWRVRLDRVRMSQTA